MYNDILVPLTADSGDIQEESIKAAKSLGCNVHVLYIVRSVAFHNNEFWDELLNAYKDRGREQLAEIEEKCRNQGINVSTDIVQGYVDEETVEYADKNDIDLIIMPRSCRGPVKDILLGSSTKRVIESSDTPVISYSRLPTGE